MEGSGHSWGLPNTVGDPPGRGSAPGPAEVTRSVPSAAQAGRRGRGSRAGGRSSVGSATASQACSAGMPAIRRQGSCPPGGHSPLSRARPGHGRISFPRGGPAGLPKPLHRPGKRWLLHWLEGAAGTAANGRETETPPALSGRGGQASPLPAGRWPSHRAPGGHHPPAILQGYNHGPRATLPAAPRCIQPP